MLLAATTQILAQTIPMTYVEVDPGMAGDCKMVGDIDGDGMPDLVIGGMPAEKLNWYRAPSWTKTVIATPTNEFTTDGALGDVDGDGDLDIIVPDGDGAGNLLWFKNPRPGGSAANGSLWVRKVIGTVGGWGKDVEPADFDQDGRLDIATRSYGQAMIFFQTSADVWLHVVLPVSSLGSEGLGQGDLDQDGDKDVIVCGAWLRNPGGTAARTPASWIEYPIGSADSSFKTVMTDLNHDGHQDVVFSSSEGTADVAWWKPLTGDPTGAWIGNTILSAKSGMHTLQAADMDLDGDTDIVAAQMHTTSDKKILILINANGLGTSWQTQEVADTGLHNGVVADIENDGDFDIYGANWTGNPPLKLWLNNLDSGVPTLTVSSPEAGAIWENGKTYAITWLKQGVQSAYVKIQLFQGTLTLVEKLTTKTDNDGSYNWTVPAELGAGGTYFIRVKTIDNLIYGSSGKFAITNGIGLALTAPNGGESWARGSLQTITWNSLGLSGNVRLVLFRDSVKIGVIATVPAAQAYYNWVAGAHSEGTAVAAKNYKIKVVTVDGACSDWSDANFTLTLEP